MKAQRSKRVAGVVAIAVAVPAAPAMAMTQLPPAAQLTPAQLEQVRGAYLADMCPAARYADKVRSTFTRVWRGRESVPYGTPMPKALRVKYRKYTVILNTRGDRLEAGAWPSDLAVPMRQLIRESRSAAKFFKSRDTPTVSRSWRPSYYHTTSASAQIRAVLNFPAEGSLC